MDTKDKHYLSLQFWNRIYKLDSTPFQAFFEDIMQSAFSDFQKIRPYGKRGDAGNDGYRPKEGIYYQVYSPQKPNEKEAEAAGKLKDDFQKIKDNWDKIAEVKFYNFVFNDKGTGVSIEIEEALSELKSENPGIEFQNFTPQNLEDIFLSLSNDKILGLGFDIDSTKAVGITSDFLKELEVELDRENSAFLLSALEKLHGVVLALHDEDLQLACEIMEARSLQKGEKIKEAKEKYENLCKRYPNDPRAFLYLSEIYLSCGDYDKNEELLNQAEKIDSNYWLLSLERLIRRLKLDEQFDVKSIDEKRFTTDSRIKSDFLRLHSWFVEKSGDGVRADSFIERAISLNPNKLANYNTKISILAARAFSRNTIDEGVLNSLRSLLSEIEKIEKITSDWGDLGPRNKVLVQFRKLMIYCAFEDITNIEKLIGECFKLLIQCYFDNTIDNIFVELLSFVELPQNRFEELQSYLIASENPISDALAKMIFIQFNFKDTIFSDGISFFNSVKKNDLVHFINILKAKKYDELIDVFQSDQRFAVMIANSAKKFPELRKKIIEWLPNDGTIQKEKIKLLLNYDEENYDEAFALLKKFDLSNLSYFECKPLLKVAQKKEAWDFVIIILTKLIEHEKSDEARLELRLQLFNANFNLEKLHEVVTIGESILSDRKAMGLLDNANKESLLARSLSARLARGEIQDAKRLLEEHAAIPKSWIFRVSIEADIYIKNEDGEQALEAIVAGIKARKNPTPEEYGGLYLRIVEVTELTGLILDEYIPTVTDNTFVKLKDQERWYFIGDGDEIDATKISPADEKYSNFIDKKLGEKISFDVKYRSDKTELVIEKILSTEKYVCWKCVNNAHKLTEEERWQGMKMIEVPSTAEGIDPKYLKCFFEEMDKNLLDFFDQYCQNSLPLALLAISEGGLTNAIGRIANEQKGFIRFSTGELEEINQQKQIAETIVAGSPFYIDGTSALVLSEGGMISKICNYLPNMKVPQSVINLILKTKDRFTFAPGHLGNMRYSQGEIVISPIHQEVRKKNYSNFDNAIKIFETKPENIYVISNANKFDGSSEQKVPAELCDACILAQKENTIVLTEDLLYLRANELDTKKAAPKYCSAFSLVWTLYEQGKITFDEYLDFFAYLTSYRFSFLPISVDDIDKAVFGDGKIKTVRPERIRLFNFPLTLSEKYGVPFSKAFVVVGQFLYKILTDDTIPPEKVVNIFVEIISEFPAKYDRRTLGQIFLESFVRAIDELEQKILVGASVKAKIGLLKQTVKALKMDIWKPS